MRGNPTVDRETILRAVAEAGVVGAGGAGFPTHVKLAGRAEWFIANGAECEPLLHGDQSLVISRPADVVRGMQMGMAATGATRGVIALKEKYHAARAAIAPLAAAAGIEIFPLGDFYPAGDEHVLVYLITGQAVPPGGIPLNLGAVVQNVATLANIARAVDAGEPVTHKHLTVTGAVRQPVTVRAPVGAPLPWLLALAGGPAVPDPVLMVGGTLMGHMAGPGETVDKRTGGLVVLPRDLPWVRRLLQPWPAIHKLAMACTQCNYCTELCPRYLLGHDIRPNRLMWVEALGENMSQDQPGGLMCCECGVCEAFACPEMLMPRQVAVKFKRLAQQHGRKASDAAPPGPVSATFQERQIPSRRMKERLGIAGYDVDAPLIPDPPPPEQVVIPLRQHLGAPAVPLVRPGDAVQAGQLIGVIPEGKLGAAVHASIAGQVLAVSETAITIQA